MFNLIKILTESPKKMFLYKYLAAVLVAMLLSINLLTPFGFNDHTLILANQIKLLDEIKAIKEEQSKHLYDKFHEYIVSLNLPNQQEYPDEIGTVYIDEEYLVIRLVDMNRKEFYKSLFDSSDNVIIEPADYSYNQLSQAYDSIDSSMGIWQSAYINVHTNRVEVNYASPLNTFNDLVVIKASELNEPNKLMTSLSTINLQQRLQISESAKAINDKKIADMVEIHLTPQLQPERELWGGDKITKPSSPGRVSVLTLGATGFYNGKPAILTAIHSNKLGEIVSYDGSRIGPVVYAKYGVGDYAIVQLQNTIHHNENKYFGPSESLKSPISISGPSTSSIYPGGTVYKYGQTTGWSMLKVLNTNGKAQYGTVTVTNLVTASLIGGLSKPGDSGGPYFTYNATAKQWYFIGVHSGSNSVNTFFTPWKEITSGFSLLYPSEG